MVYRILSLLLLNAAWIFGVSSVHLTIEENQAVSIMCEGDTEIQIASATWSTDRAFQIEISYTNDRLDAVKQLCDGLNHCSFDVVADILGEEYGYGMVLELEYYCVSSQTRSERNGV